MSSVSENTEDNSYPQQHQLSTEVEAPTDSTVVVAADASAASSGVGTEQSDGTATLSQTSCSDDDETSLNTNNESSSILDQLTCINSSEKGSNSSTLNGSVMLNVFSASGLPASRQDPASSSLPCNIPTTITSTITQQQQVANTDSLLGTQLIWENKEITSKEDNHKKKKKEPTQEAKKLDDGERESIMAELKVKRVLQKAVCSNCGRTDTPTWRKGPLGVGTLCNACGIKHSTNALFLDSGTGALIGHRPFIKYGETGHLVSEFSTVEEGKTSEEAVASSSLPTNSQTSEGSTVVAGTSGVSTPEKQKRTRGRPKGSSNKKKPSGPLETAVELPPPSPVVESQTPQLEKKRGRGRPRTKPLPVQPPTGDADQMVDEVESEQLVVGSGKGKRKRKAEDDEYVPEEPSEKPIVVQTKPKQRKIVTLPVGSDAQVLSLQNIQKTFSNNSENCIYISSDYLMQCIEGFKLTIKQGSKKNNGAINRRITTDSLVYIFFFLEMSDLITCFSVCRHWHEYAKSDVIWKEIYRRSWGIDDRSLAEYTTGILAPPPSINWFSLVQARINIRVYSPIQQVHLMSQFYAIENKPKILACIQENLNEEITTKKNNPKINM